MSSSRPRLLFVIDRIGDCTAGTEKHLVSILSRLVEVGKYELHIATFFDEGLSKYSQLAGLKYHFLAKTEHISLAGAIYRLNKLISDLCPKILNSYFVDSYLAAGYVRLFKNIIWIHHLRNMGYFENRKFMFLDFPIRSHVDHYLVNSRAVGDYLENSHRVSPGKITVIHNGIPDCILHRNSYVPNSRSKFIVGLVGNMRPVKGIEILLEAACRCKTVIPNLQIQIVGDDIGVYASRMKRLAGELELDVIFHGKQREVSMLIAGFDIAVNTSHSEGFSNAVLEYMSLERAIILSDSGGNREAIVDGESGLLFTPGDIIDLSDKIIRIFRDRELSFRLGISAKKRYAEIFTEDLMIKKYVQFYDRFIQYGRLKYF